MRYIWMTVFGISFIFVATALGAAVVFCFRKQISEKWNAICFGFASGIMISAAIWSLLLPALEQIKAKMGKFSVFPVMVGFLSGCALLLILDGIILLIREKKGQGDTSIAQISPKYQKIFLAVALHNIPEGLAVGFAFGAASLAGNYAAYLSALTLSIGIGVQNFPEGAAISLPLSANKSKTIAFLYGVVSGLPEPFFAILGFFLSTKIVFLQPWLLSLSAGAMFFVVIDDLLPSMHENRLKTSSIGTIAAMIGFVLMMALDLVFA